MTKPPEFKKAINIEGYEKLVSECIDRTDSIDDEGEIEVQDEVTTSPMSKPARLSQLNFRKWLVLFCILDLLAFGAQAMFNDAFPVKKTAESAQEELSRVFGNDYVAIMSAIELQQSAWNTASFEDSTFNSVIDRYQQAAGIESNALDDDFLNLGFRAKYFQKYGNSVEYLEPSRVAFE